MSGPSRAVPAFVPKGHKGRKAAVARQRLDRLLADRGLADSREQAARLILAGAVTVDGACVDKQGKLVPVDADICVKTSAAPYVSRAGGKLAAALDRFTVPVAGCTALDVGASTGGFTDCLLQQGARRVYAVDVGYGQFDWRLRQDARVVLIERTNIRYLDPALIKDPIDVAVIDVSFISLSLVLPCVLGFLAQGAWVVALIKPQFEAGKGRVGRGGIVREERLRQEAADKVMRCAASLGLTHVGLMDSPITGQKGNREILAVFRRTRIR
jgi:23S rRNA (cytidine1920-2'-O)/16S rRNA (cytidine1409-2'-O)-methyltransferase